MPSRTLTTKSTTQHTAVTAIIWAFAASLIEAGLNVLNVLTLPEWARPFLPVVVAILGFLLRITRDRANGTLSVSTAEIQRAMPEAHIETPKGDTVTPPETPS